jgi:hypothetical protein
MYNQTTLSNTQLRQLQALAASGNTDLKALDKAATRYDLQSTGQANGKDEVWQSTDLNTNGISPFFSQKEQRGGCVAMSRRSLELKFDIRVMIQPCSPCVRGFGDTRS